MGSVAVAEVVVVLVVAVVVAAVVIAVVVAGDFGSCHRCLFETKVSVDSYSWNLGYLQSGL